MTREPLVLAVAAMLAWAAPAAADDAPTGMRTAEKCRAEPVDPTRPSDEAEPDPDADRSAGDSLTDTLQPCNGVLVPPRIGDDGMTAPPPAEGRTPVIRPRDIPDQPRSDPDPAE